MHAVRVNETKFASKIAFNLDLFPLGNEKESKNAERTLF